MMQEDDVQLRHMLDAINEVMAFTDGKNRDDLNENRMLMHAVVRLFEIIGEAANNISDDFLREHPNMPWKQMIGMRNRLIHGYFDVDLDIIWSTIVEDLPALRIMIERIIQ